MTTVNAIGGVTLGQGAKATTVNTDGDVQSEGGQIGTLKAQGSFTETSGGKVDVGTVGGSVSKPSWNGGINITQQPGLNRPGLSRHL
ncbi:hypothetical protein [Ralstonia pseudosolanacearum]|uniref:hypothetical protein n=1 Tax=Ralstonia pseudosolanacearum TaxID=1310165 RepID=UPI0018D15B46|nr:hypothetical protein [Ralstonia pseudosolanacearum]